jgi:hypothetical protein
MIHIKLFEEFSKPNSYGLDIENTIGLLKAYNKHTGNVENKKAIRNIPIENKSDEIQNIINDFKDTFDSKTYYVYVSIPSDKNWLLNRNHLDKLETNYGIDFRWSDDEIT